MATNENGIVGGDARVRKSRGKAAQRGEPGIEQLADRADSAAGTIRTAAERRKMIRDEWTQNALPRPPEIPGYHVCWLTTSLCANSAYERAHVSDSE